jgi:diadenosine tetraphosphate (Ap4A) HIT family hydrolase
VANEKWTEQEAGIGCYLCPPRLEHHQSLTFVAHLSTSSLYLEEDQRFRGLSCLILNVHATRLDALSEENYSGFMQDLRRSVAAVRKTVQPDHMNVALLCNSCPHLHWSIVPRYRTDPRWGSPIWDDATLAEIRNSPTTKTEAEYSELIEKMRRHL